MVVLDDVEAIVQSSWSKETLQGPGRTAQLAVGTRHKIQPLRDRNRKYSCTKLRVHAIATAVESNAVNDVHESWYRANMNRQGNAPCVVRA